MNNNDFVQAAIERGKQNPNWTPLESNPDALNAFAYGIGMPRTVAFCDCFGLEPDLLAFVPRPVHAVILLFPFDNENIIRAKKEEDERLAAEDPEQSAVRPSDCFWMTQSIGNACGTIAVVHSLLNSDPAVVCEEGSLLRQFAESARPLSSEDRGYLLGGWKEVQHVHHEAAEIGQTRAPAAEEDVNYHFVSFVLRNGHVVEMDGTKRRHVVHAPCNSQETFLEDAANVIRRQYFEKDPAGNFSIILLARSEQ